MPVELQYFTIQIIFKITLNIAFEVLNCKREQTRHRQP